ncbi:MAG: NAD(+)/NADH kinase [Deltaproteobacteria bacterium]|nr:NAD(+)/NADH kinase [Deltaproteobacteria bacterium]
MAAPRVLVIYKKSVFRTHVEERRHSRVKELLEAASPAVRRVVRAHRHHTQTLERVRRALTRLGARASFRFRRDVGDTSGFDLVVTVGGDGTLLWVSHYVAKTPVLSVNSAPNDSVGFFAGATRQNVEERLELAVRGELPVTSLQRMAVKLDGELLETRVLNDVLLCHENPAAMSRYILRHGRLVEDQKSSGIWVGPAAGSTAAQRSAGGRVLSPISRMIQYVVREPYEPSGRPYRLKKGLVQPGQRFSMTSKMHEARLYADGPYRAHRVQIGQEVSMVLSPEPLDLLGFSRADSW